MASDYAKTSIEGLDWGIVTDGVVGPSGHIDGWVAVLSPPVTCTCTCTCTCMYMYVHVCTCMCMYVHVCTCMYMYVHVLLG